MSKRVNYDYLPNDAWLSEEAIVARCSKSSPNHHGGKPLNVIISIDERRPDLRQSIQKPIMRVENKLQNKTNAYIVAG